LIALQYIKKTSFYLFAQINRELFKEILYYFDYKQLHNKEAQYERKYIVKLFSLFSFIFILQCKSIKDI